MIRVALSVMFGTLSEVGYDETILRIREPPPPAYDPRDESNSTIAYVYKIGGRSFKTVRPIDELRSPCITGRATRVWEAIEGAGDTSETMPGASSVVVRDVWLDKSARTEREVQTEIFKSLRDVVAFCRSQKLGEAGEETLAGLSAEERERIRRVCACVDAGWGDVLSHLESGTYAGYFLHILVDDQAAMSGREGRTGPLRQKRSHSDPSSLYTRCFSHTVQPRNATPCVA